MFQTWDWEAQNAALWSFETARYTVALFAEPEDMSPEGSFSDERDVEFASDGDPAHWFCAVVAVYDEDGDRIGWDTLGGCSYNSFREFYTSHRDRDPANRNCSIQTPKGRLATICHYFPDMVRQAIADARTTLGMNRDGMVAAA